MKTHHLLFQMDMFREFHSAVGNIFQFVVKSGPRPFYADKLDIIFSQRTINFAFSKGHSMYFSRQLYLNFKTIIIDKTILNTFSRLALHPGQNFRFATERIHEVHPSCRTKSDYYYFKTDRQDMGEYRKLMSVRKLRSI